MATYEVDKFVSDKYRPAICAILKRLGGTDLTVAPKRADWQRNTDLLWHPPQVPILGTRRVAYRVRDLRYYARYGDEFTIRLTRPSHRTEMSKALSGYGDYFFYGFGDEYLDIPIWGLGDLAVLRTWCRDNDPHVVMSNHDGSSTFAVFRWADIPGFVIESEGLNVNS